MSRVTLSILISDSDVDTSLGPVVLQVKNMESNELQFTNGMVAGSLPPELRPDFVEVLETGPIDSGHYAGRFLWSCRLMREVKAMAVYNPSTKEWVV